VTARGLARLRDELAALHASAGERGALANEKEARPRARRA